MKIGQQSASTKEYIRVAERYISEREYELAMKQLTIAQRLEPNNIYILAIIERIHRLAAEESKEGGRFLAITVGDEFDDGIRPNGETAPRPDEIEAQVKRLTTKASELLRRGAYETAFDSLMNAYLLDPVSPLVIETERTLLPAIDMLRKGKKDGSHRMTMAVQPPSGRRTDTRPLSEEDSQRLEELRRQKEQERFTHEREMWREASKTPRILENLLPPDPPKMEPDPPPKPGSQKTDSGFFAKLRLGKFLG